MAIAMQIEEIASLETKIKTIEDKIEKILTPGNPNSPLYLWNTKQYKGK